ncbi:MAG TPA: amino acid adenylation domain-containing protein [Gaiellaceae bacterium]
MTESISRVRRLAEARRGDVLRRFAEAAGQPTRSALSHEQEQVWLLQMSQPGTTYNVGAALHLRGPLDEELLELALSTVFARHDVLRVVVRVEDEQPFQVVRESGASAFRTRDLGELPEAEREAELVRLCDAEARAPFDLQGALVRVLLVKTSPQERTLLLVANEIVLDRQSLVVVVRELGELYRALVAGEEPSLPEPSHGYLEYAAWQHRWCESDAARSMIDHWREALHGFEGTELPFERTYSLYNRWLTSEGRVLARPWPPALAAGAERYATAAGVDPLVVLQAAHAALLHRHSGQDDLALALDVDARPAGEVGLVGNFQSFLPVRLDLRGDPTFGELVPRVRDAVATARRHSRLPYPLIAAAVAPEDGNDRLPLLMTSVGLREPAPRLDFGDGVSASLELVHDATARLDLAIDVEVGTDVRTVVEYSSVLFGEESVERLLDRLALLLGAALEDPSRRVSALPIATAAELRLVVDEWNDTALPDEPATIVDRFDAVAARVPDRVAVVDELGGELTYDALRREANRFAQHLFALGVRPEDRCAVFVERSAGTVVTLLGVLKAGCAYVPVDPDVPDARLEAMLADCAAAVVVTDSSLAARVPAGPWRVVVLDRDRGEIDARPDAAPVAAVAPASLAYVMYTSGSTGGPKGVLVEHRSVCAFVRGAQELYELTEDDRFAQVSSLAFDVSTFDVFASLLTGASVCVATAETRRSLDRLRSLLRDREISVYMGTPGVLELLEPGDFPALRLLAVGGEAFSGAFATRWAHGRRFLNSYGPTETTVGVVVKECTGTWEASPPIGRATPNHRAYVLDEHLRPVPIGVTGELYVGGPGVARGYLGRSGLTASAFVPDPFSGAPGARMYRTGDLARWLPTGDLVFLGRRDRQVKVGGVRIELAEIEDALRKHPQVQQALVVPTEGSGGLTKLVAAIVAAGQAPSVSSLRAAVASWLPPNMIPSEFVVLEQLPLTDSGKVDVAAILAARDANAGQAARAVVSARTETERRVADEILKPVLELEEIGVDENFFELGGHSLQVLSVLARVRSIFGVEIRVAQFFQVPTLAGIAAAIDASHAEAVTKADRELLLDALREVEAGMPAGAASSEP